MTSANVAVTGATGHVGRAIDFRRVDPLTEALAGMVRAGTFHTPQGKGRIPFIDVRDIAAVAAEALANQQALDILGRAIGRIIRRIDIAEAAVQAMRDTGMPAFVVEAMSSLNQLIAAGHVDGATDTVGAITGRPARRFEDFSREHAAVWR